MLIEAQKNRKESILYIVLTLISCIFIFPILFMVMSSFKPDLQLLQDTSSFRAFLPVGDISMNNYREAFQRAPVGRFLLNSAFVTAVTVSIGLVINSMAGYSFAILDWKGKNILLSIIIATFIIPFETIMIPLLLEVNQLPWIGINGLQRGWLNTYHVQIVPFLAASFQIFLFYQFFRDIPRDTVEAARIDGASFFVIYWRIVLPLSGPVIGTAAILRFLDMWNQYVWPLMVIQSERFRPVQVGVLYFFQLDVAWGEVMAYLTMITLPVLIFYLSLQKTFVQSIATAGIKG